ncbi:acyltransferase [Paenibacillus koleovorans]|uniref:acyltransferase n=1 Tax=Paenibacillus koleovorans TaxID=121608 RepID=UPI000FD98519|nr:acyltransferase [Paenibacillus koleovorans]
MRKPKLFELDLVRAVAIAAVLLIHATASATVDIPFTSRAQVLYDVVNKLSYFAVFLFILLSGVVLFYSYMDNWKLSSILTFYRKRLQYILIPYLIWSFFYYLFYPAITPDWGVELDWMKFLSDIRWGDTSYHLYFMIIIMQFYLVFPLLVTIAKYWGLFRRYLWVFGVLIQVGAYLFHTYVHPIDHRVTLFPTYIGLFCIGGSIGMYYSGFIMWLNRNVWWVTAATVALGSIFTGLSILGRHGIVYSQHLFELLFNLYAVGVAASFIWIGRHLLETSPRLSGMLSSMGANSFGIYFIHPALLYVWMSYVVASPMSFQYHGVVVGGLLVIFTIPWLIVAILKRVPGSWILFGK